MIPLRITAHLLGPVAIPEGAIAVDALLAWAVATREGLPPPVGHEVTPLEIPVEREPGGRFHLASFSVARWELHETRWVNRRFPAELAQTPLGSTKIRRINIAGGPAKSYRLPLETGHLVDDLVEWYAVGEPEEIRALLSLVSHLGKRRAVGLGRVVRWTVEPCETWEGFPVVRNGKPLRPLPPDWPGLVEAATEYRTLTYPYWINTARVLCAVPEAIVDA